MREFKQREKDGERERDDEDEEIRARDVSLLRNIECVHPGTWVFKDFKVRLIYIRLNGLKVTCAAVLCFDFGKSVYTMKFLHPLAVGTAEIPRSQPFLPGYYHWEYLLNPTPPHVNK